MAKSSNKWPKVITVDKNIIKILSESTYENFPNALKEVIINSYDALATEVKIEVDLKNETITIWDNGNGMDEEDYDFYLRIAGKKREVKEYNKQERKKIGQFGVGFLAVFPFFKNYAIESKKAGETDCMHAEIPCHLYFDQYNRFIQISDIKISGGRKKENVLRNDHYTKITLTGFATITKEFFNPKSEFKVSKHSIKNKDYFSVVNKLKWLLSEDLPIEFEENYFNTFFTNYSSRLPFKVLYQNELLFRHVYAKTFILEEHKRPFSQIGKIKFQYFISTDKKPIHPNEGRYLKIRNLNVGVGDRENFLGKEIVGGYPRLQQLTGEIHILEGMNELIKVSRDGFNFSPDFEELKSFFGKKLIKYSAALQEESNQEKARSTSRIRSLKYVKPLSKPEKQKLNPLFDQPDRESKSTHYTSPKDSHTSKGEVSPIDQNEFESTLEIGKFVFKVKSDRWEYERNNFPACKIEGNNLILNAKYPLFKGVKHTDIFIKLHAFLLINFNKKVFDQQTYTLLAKEILNLYKEYWDKRS